MLGSQAIFAAKLFNLRLQAVDLLLQARQFVGNVADGREEALTNSVVHSLPNQMIDLFGIHVSGEDSLTLLNLPVQSLL